MTEEDLPFKEVFFLPKDRLGRLYFCICFVLLGFSVTMIQSHENIQKNFKEATVMNAKAICGNIITEENLERYGFGGYLPTNLSNNSIIPTPKSS